MISFCNPLVQVAKSFLHCRKPSLVPDAVRAACRPAVLEATATIAPALTVADALRRGLAPRRRREALAGLGPAADALYRRLCEDYLGPPTPPARRASGPAVFRADALRRVVGSAAIPVTNPVTVVRPFGRDDDSD